MTRKPILMVTTLLCLGVAVAACDQNKNRATQEQNPNNPGNVNAPPRAENRPADQTAKEEKAGASAIDVQKKDYHARIDAELKDIDNRVDAMKDTLDKEKSGPAKDADKKLLDDVSDRRSALKSDLHDIDSAKESEWPVVKQKADRDLDELRRSVRSASARIHVVGPRGVTNPQKNP